MSCCDDVKKLKIVKMYDDAKVPVRANPTDSGLDVFAYNFKKAWTKSEDGEAVVELSDRATSIELQPMSRVMIGTGLKMTVAPGYEIQVRPKSGLSAKQGLIVSNPPGTVDYSFSEIVCVLITNLSNKAQVIEKGQKIAQLVVAKVELIDVEVVDALDNGDRSGFGSTGLK